MDDKDNLPDVLNELRTMRKERIALTRRNNADPRLSEVVAWTQTATALIDDMGMALRELEYLARLADQNGAGSLCGMAHRLRVHEKQMMNLHACRQFIRALCPYLSPSDVYNNPDAAVQTVRDHISGRGEE